MAVTRTNVMTDIAARGAYIQGVQALKAEFPAGATTDKLGVNGPKQQLSTWDLFVMWHGRASSMSQNTVIHQGPVFLPWHRWMLLLMEANIARALGRPNFALPYWDWAVDGNQPKAQQPASAIFAKEAFGGGRGSQQQEAPVPDGPFGSTGSFVVRVVQSPTAGLISVSRPLRRRLGVLTRLPRQADVTGNLAVTPYDASPYNGTSTGGMRNQLEGWAPSTRTQPVHLHNQVHVFIGGDMEKSTSPNDPLFYMNHANIDRIWAAWQQQHATLPTAERYPTGAGVPAGHRLTDSLYSALTNRLTAGAVIPKVNEMISTSALYAYDMLPT